MDNTAVREIKFSSINIEELKRSGKIFRENAGASIIDIGDRVALVEFHTKANTINSDVCEMLHASAQDGNKYFDAVVIGNHGKHFSAGANLALLREQVQAGNWKGVEESIRQLQEANMAIKYADIPVVAAPFSYTVGGGCEICLHSSAVVIAELTNIGLVETGVGLVPAGGGTKELGLRAQTHSNKTDLAKDLVKVFDTIMTARVSRDGNEAKQLFFSEKDIVVKDYDLLIEIAKQTALELVRSGYHNGSIKTDLTVLGTKGISLFESYINSRVEGEVMSEHDATIGKHVATILCGGNVPTGVAGEQHFLDLEREAFLSLLGTKKTQERIEYLLKNNKTLHN